MIEPNHAALSIGRQCKLLGLSRAAWYYKPATESDLNLELMRLIDEQYMLTPFYGYRKMTHWLRRQGYNVNRKRVRRLMRLMGITALYTRPNTTRRAKNHPIYPYLLRDVTVESPNHVWSSDITYIPLARGFMYLVAVIDWYSRYILSWQLSNTLESIFCVQALQDALKKNKPAIFNTDQGAQFTSHYFTDTLKAQEIAISMDGKGRALDNIFIERFWRSLKYEDIYLKRYETVSDLTAGLQRYFAFYNQERIHQSLAYKTPLEVYSQGAKSLKSPPP